MPTEMTLARVMSNRETERQENGEMVWPLGRHRLPSDLYRTLSLMT